MDLTKRLADSTSVRIGERFSDEAEYLPSTTLEALYLRMYLDVAGQEPMRACLACGKELIDRRSSCKFCDPACKNAYHSRRRTMKRASAS
jgi:hypothetical protein